MSWKTKIISTLITFMMLFSITAIPAHAYSMDQDPPRSPFGDPTSLYTYQSWMLYFDHYSISKNQVDAGFKSFLVKEACEFLSWLLRKGVTNDIVMEQVTKYFDKAAAEGLKKHSVRIGQELDRIGNLPDVTVQIVKEKIYYFMTGPTLKMNGGTAKVIAEGIATGINFLIF